MTGEVKYLFSGDCALTMEFGNEINPQINSRVRQVADLLEQANMAGILDWIPTYRSILIKYNPSVKKGCRAYLAVQGGFDIPCVMGSKSICLQHIK
jgi:allophanate hydrolase subunit 1